MDGGCNTVSTRHAPGRRVRVCNADSHSGPQQQGVLRCRGALHSAGAPVAPPPHARPRHRNPPGTMLATTQPQNATHQHQALCVACTRCQPWIATHANTHTHLVACSVLCIRLSAGRVLLLLFLLLLHRPHLHRCCRRLLLGKVRAHAARADAQGVRRCAYACKGGAQGAGVPDAQPPAQSLGWVLWGGRAGAIVPTPTSPHLTFTHTHTHAHTHTTHAETWPRVGMYTPKVLRGRTRGPLTCRQRARGYQAGRQRSPLPAAGWGQHHQAHLRGAINQCTKQGFVRAHARGERMRPPTCALLLHERLPRGVREARAYPSFFGPV